MSEKCFGLKEIIGELGCVTIYCDIQSVIHLVDN